MKKLLILLIVLGVISGCAAFNRNNTPVLNMVEKKIVPKDKTMQIVTLPLTFPLGAVAITIDAVIVHPASVIDDSAKDTNDHLDWDSQWKGCYATQSAALMPKTALTPVVFLTSFFIRSAFNLEKNISDEKRKQRKEETQAKEEQKREETEESLKQAKELYTQKNYQGSVAITERIIYLEKMERHTREKFGILHLKNLLRLNDLPGLDRFLWTYFSQYEWPLDDELKNMLKDVIISRDLTQKARVIPLLSCFVKGEAEELLILALDDPDPVVRYLTLAVAFRKRNDFANVIKKATQDSHEIIRLRAKIFLEEGK